MEKWLYFWIIGVITWVSGIAISVFLEEPFAIGRVIFGLGVGFMIGFTAWAWSIRDD